MKTVSLAQETKIVSGLIPATDAAGRTGQYVSMKNFMKAFFIVHIAQGNAATIAVDVLQATDVSGTGAKALTINVPIWSNLNVATNDTLVRRPDGVTYTTDAGVANKQVVIEIDPAFLDINNGFDCIAVRTGASNVANLTAATYILGGPRYAMDTIPSAIVN